MGLADCRVLDEMLDAAEAQRKPKAGATVPARCSRYQRLVRRAGGRGELRSARGLGEIISFAQTVINATGDLGSMRSAHSAAASADQNHQHDSNAGLHWQRAPRLLLSCPTYRL